VGVWRSTLVRGALVSLDLDCGADRLHEVEARSLDASNQRDLAPVWHLRASNLDAPSLGPRSPGWGAP
jgi:hypothetical protein